MDREYNRRSTEGRVRLLGGGPRCLLPQGGGVVRRPNLFDAQAALQPRLGFHRRRLLARDIALLASSLDFLQGTSEKIHFHRLVRQ